jgi:flagellar biosynthesis/type III secretory pathway protein FliH
MVGILKANQMNPMTANAQPIAFNMHDMEEAARSHLLEVKQKAHQLIEQAKVDAERIRKEVAEQARRDALAEMEAKFQQRAKEMADKQTTEAVTSMRAVLSGIQKEMNEWLSQWRDETLSLSMAIAEKVIRQRVENEPEIVLQWLIESTASWSGARRIEIRIHPQVHSALATRIDDLLKPFASQVACTVIDDAQIEKGGCIVRTDLGVMDWQISTQLGRLEEQLR